MENVLGSQSCSAALLCEQVDLCPTAPLCEPVELFKFKFFSRLLTNRGRMHVRLPGGLQTLCLMMLNIKDE